MKKLLLALPVLAISAMFTFCHKSEVSTTLPGSTVENPVTDRNCGDPCSISIVADNLNQLNVCGVANNQNICTDCSSGLSSGTATIVGTAVIVVRACKSFSVSNPNASATWISFDGGATHTMIPAGGCVTFTTDMNCTVS